MSYSYRVPMTLAQNIQGGPKKQATTEL